MSENKMTEKIGRRSSEDSIDATETRREFLKGMGKWSKIALAAAVIGSAVHKASAESFAEYGDYSDYTKNWFNGGGWRNGGWRPEEWFNGGGWRDKWRNGGGGDWKNGGNWSNWSGEGGYKK